MSPRALRLAPDAELAASLLAIDPAGLGGAVLRGAPGSERDAWLTALREALPQGAPMGKAPLGIADERLLGGLDLPASLAAGRPVVQRGVLAAHHGGVVALPMAERLDGGTAARLAAVLDAGEVAVERDGVAARLPARLALVLLDEGVEPEERPPAALLERMAFRVELGRGASFDTPSSRAAQDDEPGRWSGRVQSTNLRHAEQGPREGTRVEARTRRDAASARGRLAQVTVPDPLVEALCQAAAAFGIESVRAPLLAVRAARAHAALHGRAVTDEADAETAVRLVLAPRAVTLPAAEQAEESAPPPPEAANDATEPRERPVEGDDAERLVAAVQAALPDRLLEAIVAGNLRAARAPRRGGAGAAARSAERGRPAGSRPGPLRSGARLNLPETLRAAAPWRRLRGGVEGRVPVRAEDFRIRRFVRKRESTTIFVVDASGSAAFHRLGEAKGAVELLLAKAYVSRARVALVAFREARAEVLLPPTRSLARARRSLADLPGGGGTPLATGLDAALALAEGEIARDRTPLLVVLTDGRANIGRDGAPGRPAAERDALASAARVREAGIGAAFVDTSSRPQPGGDRFARAMGAVYAPLPYADAQAVSGLVDGLRGGRGA